MRGNRLPVSAARWQHVPQKCFPTFMEWKITKLQKTSTTVKAREKNEPRFGVLRNLLMYVWINLKTIKSYLIKLATEFYWQPSCLLGERSSLYHYTWYTCLGPSTQIEMTPFVLHLPRWPRQVHDCHAFTATSIFALFPTINVANVITACSHINYTISSQVILDAYRASRASGG